MEDTEKIKSAKIDLDTLIFVFRKSGLDYKQIRRILVSKIIELMDMEEVEKFPEDDEKW